MEDKIVEVKEEMGSATLEYKDGRKVPHNTKTTYTIWESGRKDCNVHILDAIDISSQAIKPE